MLSVIFFQDGRDLFCDKSSSSRQPARAWRRAGRCRPCRGTLASSPRSRVGRRRRSAARSARCSCVSRRRQRSSRISCSSSPTTKVTTTKDSLTLKCSSSPDPFTMRMFSCSPPSTSGFGLSVKNRLTHTLLLLLTFFAVVGASHVLSEIGRAHV